MRLDYFTNRRNEMERNRYQNSENKRLINAERERARANEIKLPKLIRCLDCGEYGHSVGHMECQYPQ